MFLGSLSIYPHNQYLFVHFVQLVVGKTTHCLWVHVNSVGKKSLQFQSWIFSSDAQHNNGSIICSEDTNCFQESSWGVRQFECCKQMHLLLSKPRTLMLRCGWGKTEWRQRLKRKKTRNILNRRSGRLDSLSSRHQDSGLKIYLYSSKIRLVDFRQGAPNKIVFSLNKMAQNLSVDILFTHTWPYKSVLLV